MVAVGKLNTSNFTCELTVFTHPCAETTLNKSYCVRCVNGDVVKVLVPACGRLISACGTPSKRYVKVDNGVPVTWIVPVVCGHTVSN